MQRDEQKASSLPGDLEEWVTCVFFWRPPPIYRYRLSAENAEILANVSRGFVKKRFPVLRRWWPPKRSVEFARQRRFGQTN